MTLKSYMQSKLFFFNSFATNTVSCRQFYPIEFKLDCKEIAKGLKSSSFSLIKNILEHMSEKIQPLALHSVIGFGGQVPNGLHYHPDGNHLVYSLGSTLVIQKIGNSSEKSIFLQSHDGPITCIALSKSGRYIASGQSTHMGFKVDLKHKNDNII